MPSVSTSSKDKTAYHGARYDPNYRASSPSKKESLLSRAVSEKDVIAKEIKMKSNFSVKFNYNVIEESVDHPELTQETEEDEKRRKIIEIEDKQIGDIAFAVYKQYFVSGGPLYAAFVISVMIASQAVSMVADYWLKWWAVSQFGDQREDKYIIVFAVLLVLVVIFGFLRALLWFRFSLGERIEYVFHKYLFIYFHSGASSIMHKKCLWYCCS